MPSLAAALVPSLRRSLSRPRRTLIRSWRRRSLTVQAVLSSVGSGNWGSAIAHLVGKNVKERSDRFETEVHMWCFEEEVRPRVLTRSPAIDLFQQADYFFMAALYTVPGAQVDRDHQRETREREIPAWDHARREHYRRTGPVQGCRGCQRAHLCPAAPGTPAHSADTARGEFPGLTVLVSPVLHPLFLLPVYSSSARFATSSRARSSLTRRASRSSRALTSRRVRSTSLAR